MSIVKKKKKKVAAHMTRLTRGEVKLEWGDPCERAFQKLKRRLTSASVLRVPERGQGYIMCCDASNDGLGCVLSVWEGRSLWFLTVEES